MLYHASPIGGIQRLEPHISNHGESLVYLSRKRENVLVYLSNAIERYCRETGFPYDGPWQAWGPYGFEKDGRLRLEEYYPNALESTYRGVSGYIYSVNDLSDPGRDMGIRDVVTSSAPVDVAAVEFVPDAYEAILAAEREGLITVLRFEQMPERMRAWNKATIRKEYAENASHPEYRHFLRGNFAHYLKDFEI